MYNKGKNAHSNSVVLFCLQKTDVKKIGFTATKKIGNAVIRNRAKRRLRALFVKHSPTLKDGSYVFVAKLSTIQVSAQELEKDFLKVLSKMKAIKI